MHIFKMIGSLVVVGFLGACSGTVTQMPQTSNYNYQNEKYNEIQISTNQATMSEEKIFDQQAFQTALENALKEKGLVDTSSAKTIRVDIKNVRLRSQGAAVMFGFLAGTDSLAGTVSLLDEKNNLISKFDVDASYGAGGLIGGLDGTRMEWLYNKFAELTSQTITQ